MATSELLLFDTDRVDPAANAPGVTTSASAAAATTNTFQTRFRTLDLDQTTDEATSYQFRMPSNYLSGGTVVIQWIATPTTNNVVFKVAAFVSTDGSTDIDTNGAFGTPTLSSVTPVPGTSGHTKTTSIAMTSPGFAAGRLTILMVGRDADHASDNAAGDIRILSVTLQYTS